MDLEQAINTVKAMTLSGMLPEEETQALEIALSAMKFKLQVSTEGGYQRPKEGRVNVDELCTDR